MECSGLNASSRIFATENLTTSAVVWEAEDSVYFMKVTPSSLVHTIIKMTGRSGYYTLPFLSQIQLCNNAERRLLPRAVF